MIYFEQPCKDPYTRRMTPEIFDCWVFLFQSPLLVIPIFINGNAPEVRLFSFCFVTIYGRIEQELNRIIIHVTFCKGIFVYYLYNLLINLNLYKVCTVLFFVLLLQFTYYIVQTSTLSDLYLIIFNLVQKGFLCSCCKERFCLYTFNL